MSHVRVIDADGHVDVRHPDGGLDDVLSKNSKEAVNQFLRQQSQRFRDLPGPGSNNFWATVVRGSQCHPLRDMD